MDALTLLTADHNRVRGLFARFTSAKEAGDTAAMVELAGLIDHELDVHTQIEEEVFYPGPAVSPTSEVVDEGIEEHHVVKVLLGEVADLTPGDDVWVAKLTVVAENVEHHAERRRTRCSRRSAPPPTPMRSMPWPPTSRRRSRSSVRRRWPTSRI